MTDQISLVEVIAPGSISLVEVIAPELSVAEALDVPGAISLVEVIFPGPQGPPGQDGGGANAAEDVTFTPAGDVAATNVQDAIEELDSEKLSTAAAATTYQPLDSDLTSIAGLSPTNDDFMQRKGGAWTNRSVAQAKTDLNAAATPWQSFIYCVAATTGPITIATALNAGDTIDGVTLNNGDFVLVKDQASAVENGVYGVFTTPFRAGHFPTYYHYAGALISVTQGTVNEGTVWKCTNGLGGTLDASVLNFARVAGLDTGVIEGLSPSNDDFLQRKSGNWANRTVAQVLTDLAAAGTTFQPLDSDLTAVAGLSSTGLIARTGSGTAAVRTITGTSNQVSVSNGDGVSGNPTLSTPQDIHSAATPTFSTMTLSGGVLTMSNSVIVTSTANNLTLSGNAAYRQYQDNTNTNIPGLNIEQDGTGDSWLQFLLTATRAWCFGIDNSDSDKLKLSPAADAFASSVWAMDTSGNIVQTGTLTLPNTGLIVGASTPFSDSSGTLTLQNVDALDSTTESTIEGAIDTLANLTSIQGRTVTLADAGANAIFGWDDGAGAYENLTKAQAQGVLGLATSTTDNAISRYDSTGGNTQNSGCFITDSNEVLVGSNVTTGGLPRGLVVNYHAASIAGALFTYHKSRGSAGSPAAVASGDYGGFFSFKHHDGTNYLANAYIGTRTTNTPSTGSIPTEMFFSVSAANDDDPYSTSTVKMTIDHLGNVCINRAAIATNATDGFLYVPTCAGTPTGTPTTKTGLAPIVINTTNNKLYFYSGGAWRDAGP